MNLPPILSIAYPGQKKEGGWDGLGLLGDALDGGGEGLGREGGLGEEEAGVSLGDADDVVGGLREEGDAHERGPVVHRLHHRVQAPRRHEALPSEVAFLILKLVLWRRRDNLALAVTQDVLLGDPSLGEDVGGEAGDGGAVVLPDEAQLRQAPEGGQERVLKGPLSFRAK